MNQEKLKFAFFGTPDVGSETLAILEESGYTPSLIITAPDRPVGRHFVMTSPAVKVWADQHNIPTLQPEKITSELIQQLTDDSYDLFIVVAYGKILPEKLIHIPRLGTVNIHYSLLPRYRGASPTETAILSGDKETGVSLQQMVFALDAGPIIAEQKIQISDDETTPSLRKKLIPLGAKLLVETIPHIIDNTITPREQNEELMTHCGKIKKEDGLVNPTSDDPELLWRKYRAYQPWPGIYFMEQGKRIKITSAVFENNKFIIKKVIPEGKKEIDWYT